MPPATSDSITETLYLRLVPTDYDIWPAPLTAKSKETLSLILQELRPLIATPRGLVLHVGPSSHFGPPSAQPGRADRGIPMITPRIAFTLSAHGRVTGIQLHESSIAPAIDSTLLRALHLADSLRSLAGLLLDVGGDTADTPDTLRLHLSTSTSVESTVATLPFLRGRLPLYHMTAVKPDRRNRAPSYPSAARQARAEGSVLIQFVVDTAGRVDLSTVRLLQPTYREFIQAVLERLPSFRYRSAQIGRCRVRELVEQPFVFNIAQ
jgi:TonB family protein